MSENECKYANKMESVELAYHSQLNLATNVIEGSANIILSKGNEIRNTIGQIQLRYYVTKIYKDEIDLLDAAATYSMEEEHGMLVLGKYYGKAVMTKKIVLLSHFIIDDLYRKQGYGLQAMYELLKYLTLFEVDVIALSVSHAEQESKNDYNLSVKQLESFYKRFGFRYIHELEDERVHPHLMFLEMTFDCFSKGNLG
ncbi:N-acetyltransferase [Pontibacillus litoralis]|uniref:N-acetyltransferase domain-containing protein n=1 Tax=Pontibacillus litoralis JSM 072002 TaxID=1385512 RepID=A0A0A5G7D7_9BACI|nr:N-acetyltransferase [Pontibacillus litoralis]KGX87083.1 hypothetical protein N784_02685 [Pontibacillus litoralis JSM 072002]